MKGEVYPRPNRVEVNVIEYSENFNTSRGISPNRYALQTRTHKQKNIRKYPK